MQWQRCFPYTSSTEVLSKEPDSFHVLAGENASCFLYHFAEVFGKIAPIVEIAPFFGKTLESVGLPLLIELSQGLNKTF